jgi:SNF2 family DNA or RNA helicase
LEENFDLEEEKESKCFICSKNIKITEFVDEGKKMANKFGNSSGNLRFANLDGFFFSTKMKKLLEILEEQKKKNLGEKIPLKTVVFSQFTGFLDLIEVAAKFREISFTRLDGKMTDAARQTSIEKFKTSLTINVFLCSLKAGGVGLNLPEASSVVLLDPWWSVRKKKNFFDIFGSIFFFFCY